MPAIGSAWKTIKGIGSAFKATKIGRVATHTATLPVLFGTGAVVAAGKRKSKKPKTFLQKATPKILPEAGAVVGGIAGWAPGAAAGAAIGGPLAPVTGFVGGMVGSTVGESLGRKAGMFAEKLRKKQVSIMSKVSKDLKPKKPKKFKITPWHSLSNDVEDI